MYLFISSLNRCLKAHYFNPLVVCILSIIFVNFAHGTGLNTVYCSKDEHCPTCFVCSVNGVCVPVPEGTDPLNDCKYFCNTRMICSEQHHCALPKEPTCDCDYTNGICKNKHASKIIDYYEEEPLIDNPKDQLIGNGDNIIKGRETVEEALENGEEEEWERRARMRGPPYRLTTTQVALTCIAGIIVCICVVIACVNTSI